MNNRRLQRRQGTEGHKTYWLDLAGDGFAKLHTSKEDAPREVCPERRHLAAMVERAPELAQALAQMLDVVALKCPGAMVAMPECGNARDLLAEIAAFEPGPDHAEK